MRKIWTTLFGKISKTSTTPHPPLPPRLLYKEWRSKYDTHATDFLKSLKAFWIVENYIISCK